MTTIEFAADAAITPISKLRQAAKELSRTDGIKLSEALDRVAQEAIGGSWDRLMATSWTAEIHGKADNDFISRPTLIRRQKSENVTLQINRLMQDRVGFGAPSYERVSAMRHFSHEDWRDLETVLLSVVPSGDVGIPLTESVINQLRSATTVQAACAAWILAYEDVKHRIPADHVTYDTSRAIEAGVVSDRGPDDDVHFSPLRLQRFSGADGSVTWRVSFRAAMNVWMHPTLYISAGQIDGKVDPNDLAAEILEKVRAGELIELSKNGFYVHQGVGVPFALPLAQGPVLATIGVRWSEEMPRKLTNGWAENDIRETLDLIRATITMDKMEISDASHLGRDVKDGPDQLPLWGWGWDWGNPDELKGDGDAISKRTETRPNARMRYLDHHLLRGLTSLVAMTMKYPAGEAAEAPRAIGNAVYLWSEGEHTNGSNEEEPFKRDCAVFQEEERREKNRNARSLFIMEAMERMVTASYIDLPQTIELRRQIGLMSAYYRKLAKGQVADLSMTKTSGHKPLPSRCIGGGARRAVRSVRA
jgi:hypothetical protein